MGRLEKVVRVSEANHERLDRLKPYETMTYNEFIGELLRVYEERAAGNGGSGAEAPEA